MAGGWDVRGDVRGGGGGEEARRLNGRKYYADKRSGTHSYVKCAS